MRSDATYATTYATDATYATTYATDATYAWQTIYWPMGAMTIYQW